MCSLTCSCVLIRNWAVALMAVARYEAVRWPLRPKKVCEGRSLLAIFSVICMYSCAYGGVRLFEEKYSVYSCEGNLIMNEPLLLANTYYRNVVRNLGFLVLQAFGPILTVFVFSCTLICELRRARLKYVNLHLSLSLNLNPNRHTDVTDHVLVQRAAQGEPIAGWHAPQSRHRDGEGGAREQPRQGGVGRPHRHRALRALLRARDAAVHREHSHQQHRPTAAAQHHVGAPRIAREQQLEASILQSSPLIWALLCRCSTWR